MKTVLPEPVGPQIKVCPVSLRMPPSGSVGIAGVEREVKRRARAGDEERQRLAPVIARRAPRRVVVKRHHGAKLREVIGALRGRIGKFPGSCAQKAASSARSSRATVMPVSASMRARQRDVIVQALRAALAPRLRRRIPLRSR